MAAEIRGRDPRLGLPSPVRLGGASTLGIAIAATPSGTPAPAPTPLAGERSRCRGLQGLALGAKVQPGGGGRWPADLEVGKESLREPAGRYFEITSSPGISSSRFAENLWICVQF